MTTIDIEENKAADASVLKQIMLVMLGFSVLIVGVAVAISIVV